MKFTLAGLFFTACGLVHSIPTPSTTKPPRFFLIGDSTVAKDGGWGDGLLNYLNPPARGENRAVGGLTTASLEGNGRWDALIDDIYTAKDEFEPVVTIQFGHHDQELMQLDEFCSNLVDIGNDIKKAGGTPVCDDPLLNVDENRAKLYKIFITPLTRRTFSGGEVVEDLKEWAAATIAAAEDVGAEFLELNGVSTAYVNKIGSRFSDYYNWHTGDRTNLNPWGENVFGHMVLDLLLEKRGDFSAYFVTNKAFSEMIKFATGKD
ncbi:putative acetylesterase [Fusarium longipes]|uniref:Putative acetylesterase n=1 Tax=Fusarium longipes TaxID=694270 RepID=A0A395T1W3_9HYPO|nr:putative acetylesterase [Fusarium longipes]